MAENSVMSKSLGSIPLGSFQSKWYSNKARESSTLVIPNDMPGHILLPAPNGINSKLLPLKSIELPTNLSALILNSSNPIKKTQRRKDLSKSKASSYLESFLHNQYELIMITTFLAKGSPRIMNV
ncbi:hypothetical protein F8388_008119 [Cannabis sativa]|uniref:Uncharacterized protein n=1 Tax=Cannabis sativa TaxID=3483 RepID=A0A7J6EV51_CANSA|nr:hypothetical protein F8388_008119 [Cannabis sativa]